MTEPLTTLSDFGLTLLAWWAAFCLQPWRTDVPWSRRLWASGLAAQGMGALLGAVYHGWFGDTSDGDTLWRITLIALGIASGLLCAGLGFAVLRKSAATGFAAVMIAKVFVYSACVSASSSFVPALIDQALGLLILAILLIVGRKRLQGTRGAVWMGIGATLAGGVIQATKVALPPFDHNVLYHLFCAVALWCFYRGGSGLKDRHVDGE
jgi:hypothetical protein